MEENKVFYDMDTMRGNCLYECNYVSDLSEFTDEEQRKLLDGKFVCISEEDYDEEGKLIESEYVRINFEPQETF